MDTLAEEPSKEARRVRFDLIDMAHEGCPSQLVAFHRGEWSLACWCRWCSDLKPYEVRIRHLEDTEAPRV
jgi:hypothetical protein